MAKYILDANLSDGCWNCPCEGEGWRCNAAGYRELPIGGSLPNDYIPEWCPLEPVADNTRYHITYKDEDPDRFYGIPTYFDTLDEAKEWISELRKKRPYHDYEVHELIEFHNVVYREA